MVEFMGGGWNFLWSGAGARAELHTWPQGWNGNRGIYGFFWNFLWDGAVEDLSGSNPVSYITGHRHGLEIVDILDICGAG